METKVTQVYWSNRCGKWMEFWTQPDIKQAWDVCCKAYAFFDALDAANLGMHVANHGIVGLRLEWEQKGVNWELVRAFLVDENGVEKPSPETNDETE